MLQRQFRLAQAALQQPPRALTHLLQWKRQRRKRGIGVGGISGAVATDDLYVLGHTQTQIAQRQNRSQRRVVVATQQAIGSAVLEDPRCAYKVEHRLLDIVVIEVCAIIACAENFEDMALYGRSKLSWLQQFLPLPNGIPSHDTFRRVLLQPCAVAALCCCSLMLLHGHRH